MRTGLLRRLPPRVGRKRPIRQVGNAHRTIVLIQILPDLVEVVQVSAQPEAGAGALECLGFRPRRRILVVRPFLSHAGVGPKAAHGYVETTTTLAQMTLCFCPLPPLLSVRSKFCATWTL